MPNEVILIVSLIFLYLSVLMFFKFFGTKGLYCFSVFATICANIEVMILVKAFGLAQTLGNILFATTFLITDIVSEVDGKDEANKVVNISLCCSVLFVIVTQLWLQYTPTDGDWA
ncbi:MAG: queuosine precursor transporter, partial [Clostridia bacterium]